MGVTSLLQRVENDPKFAEELQVKVQAAAGAAPGGPEWSALLDAVAETPEERAKMATALSQQTAASPEALARMTTKLQNIEGGAPTTTTTTLTITGTATTTLVTTLDCGIAMTTLLA